MTDRDSSNPTSSASSSVSVEAEEQKKSSRPQIILFTHITFTPRNMRPPPGYDQNTWKKTLGICNVNWHCTDAFILQSSCYSTTDIIAGKLNHKNVQFFLFLN